jgi:hypothetical protein
VPEPSLRADLERISWSASEEEMKTSSSNEGEGLRRDMSIGIRGVRSLGCYDECLGRRRVRIRRTWSVSSSSMLGDSEGQTVFGAGKCAVILLM